MVVLHHLQNQTQRLGLPHMPAEGLQAGVDIFFVISGFIMWVTTVGGRRTALDFYRDRLARIAPLYWVMSGIVLAVLWICPSIMYNTTLDWPHVVTSFLFIAWEHPVSGSHLPLLVPGWSLNLEMFFYLLFGGAIALARKNSRWKAISILTCLAVIYGAGRAFTLPGTLAFYSQGLLLEFAAGIAIGIVYVSGKVRPAKWAIALMAAGALVLLLVMPYPTPIAREFIWGVPATAIVAGAVFAVPFNSGPLERLGDWSYSLYLSHPISLSASFFIWRTLASQLPTILFPLFGIACSLVVAFVIYRFVELPATNAAKSLLKRPQPT